MFLINPMWLVSMWPLLNDLGGAKPVIIQQSPTCQVRMYCRDSSAAATPAVQTARVTSGPFQFASFRPFNAAPVAVSVAAGGGSAASGGGDHDGSSGHRAAHAYAIAQAGGDDDDDDDSVQVIDIQDEDAEGYPPQGGPWLGVQFAPVPAALAAQMNQEGGALVLNVAEDSPAAAAGLKQYDVVTSFNGQPIGDAEESVRDLVGKTSVGQTVALKVLRGGNPTSVSLTIGARPELKDADGHGSIKYLYKTPDWGQTQLEYVNPRMFMMDKQGKLIEPDEDSVKQFHKLIPKLHGNALKGLARLHGIGQGSSQVTIKQSRDGETIEVTRDAAGKFTVSRASKGGNPQTQEYADEAALKAGDADAYKLYSDSSGNGSFQVFGNGAFGNGAGKAFQYRFDNDDWGNDESVKDALKQAEKAMGQARGMRWRMHDRPGVSFQRKADGTIRVTTRDGDGELVEDFRNENELQRERPQLFERYSKMKTLDPDDADEDK